MTKTLTTKSGRTFTATLLSEDEKAKLLVGYPVGSINHLEAYAFDVFDLFPLIINPVAISIVHKTVDQTLINHIEHQEWIRSRTV